MMLKGCWFSLRPMVWDLFLTCGGERKTCRFCVFLGSLNVCRSAWFLHVVLGQPNQQLGWHVAEHERANYRCYHLSSGEASYPAYSMLFNVFFWYGQTCSASGLSAHLLPYRWPVETECAWASKGSEGMCSSTCLRVQSPKSWFWLGSYQDISRLFVRWAIPCHSNAFFTSCTVLQTPLFGHGSGGIGHHLRLAWDMPTLNTVSFSECRIPDQLHTST
jgi:hypothetical protein